MAAKLFLIVCSVLYLGLGLWCTVSPQQTSEKVGFELKGGSGNSEFMTVYGGLEFGMGLVFLLAAFRPDMVTFGVISCVVIHAMLCLFRSISLYRFSDIDPFTYQLAIGEWVIFLVGLAILFWPSKPASV